MSLQSTFVATLVDEWIRCGVRHAVIAPGSRSTPLALALAQTDELNVHVHIDERSAGFLALGIGIATGVPAVVVTTSGTAAVELHPAVVEASQARVPMLVCTADRPMALRDVGAPQAINQTHLYGSTLRWFYEPGVADGFPASTWRSLGSRCIAESMGSPPGPVHLNLAFTEPLVGEPEALPDGRIQGRPWHQVIQAPRGVDAASLNEIARVLDVGKGVIVAGGPETDPTAVLALASASGWPVLADPRSGCRVPSDYTIGAFDALLRDKSFAKHHRAEVVVRIGELPASKVLNYWLAGTGACQVLIDPDGSWLDPDRILDWVVVGEPSTWCLALSERLGSKRSDEWTSSWISAERKAQSAIDEYLQTSFSEGTNTEPAIARRLVEQLEPGTTLFVSSSMPVRDVEWYSAPRDGVKVISNRGANGIDGVISSATGVALASNHPTALFIGDLAFLHDTNGLLGLARRNLDLTIVVIDNHGGGIFSFLPQASMLDVTRFEQLFGTPQDVDITSLISAHGIATLTAHDLEGFDVALDVAMRTSGTHVIVVPTDRDHNVVVHDEIHEAIARKLKGSV